MTSEKDIVKLENENKELKQLLEDTLKAFSILKIVKIFIKIVIIIRIFVYLRYEQS